MSDQSTDAMVELIKVSKTYRPNIRALEEVSISIRSGEMVFITGRSGAVPCGKLDVVVDDVVVGENEVMYFT